MDAISSDQQKIELLKGALWATASLPLKLCFPLNLSAIFRLEDQTECILQALYMFLWLHLSRWKELYSVYLQGREPANQMLLTQFCQIWVDHMFRCLFCSIWKMNFFQCLIIINLSLWGGRWENGIKRTTWARKALPHFSCFRLEFFLLLLTKSKTSQEEHFPRNIIRRWISFRGELWWGRLGEDFLCCFISGKSQFLVMKIISAQERPKTKRKLERPVYVSCFY